MSDYADESLRAKGQNPQGLSHTRTLAYPANHRRRSSMRDDENGIRSRHHEVRQIELFSLLYVTLKEQWIFRLAAEHLVATTCSLAQ